MSVSLNEEVLTYKGYYWNSIRNDIFSLENDLKTVISSDYYRSMYEFKSPINGYKFYFLVDKNNNINKAIDMPLLVEFQGVKYMVIDLRSNLKETFYREVKLRGHENMTLKDHIRDYHIFEFQTMVAMYQMELLSGGDPLSSYRANFIRIFGKWFASNISRKIMASIYDDKSITVFAEFYFYLLYQKVNSRILGDKELSKTSIDFHKVNYLNRYLANDEYGSRLIGKVDYELGEKSLLEETIRQIKNNVDNSALGSITTQVVAELLSLSWIGINREETIRMAITNIPVFASMLYVAMTEKAYNMTGFSKLIVNNRTLQKEKDEMLDVFKNIKGKYSK